MTRAVLGTMLAGVAAIGCGREEPPPAPATFNKDIAPIVYANCATCHRPGGDAPFSLLTYTDAAPRADEIADETRVRHMPPWLPEPGDVPIAGVRRLSAADIDTIQRWVRDGAREGAAEDLPPPPAFSTEWQLGPPDLVLTMPRPYVLKPGPEDVYRNVVLHGNLPKDVFIRAVELRRNDSPIHHAMIRLAPASSLRAHDGVDGQPGFDGMASGILHDPDGQSLGWAPGRGPMVSPEGMPWRLERGTAVVIELHLMPGDEPVNIQPSIGLYFSSTPPVRTPVTGTIASKLIDIPPGESNYVVTNRYELPVAAELIGLFPHAHFLGKEMLVTATPPAATPITLLHIKHWSFHWQQDYRYVKPVPLPKGTVIDLRFTYDNSAANSENPSDPPVRVRLGPRSTDEMANLSLQFVTSSPADTMTLATSFAFKNALDNIAYAETRLRETPDSVENLALLGASYVQVGRFAEAVPPLTEALRLAPRDAIAHSQLGGAYLGLGQLPDAVSHFREAARLAPNDERAHRNLADALERSGRLDDAVAAYRRAIAANEESLVAHARLGALLHNAGRPADAVPHFRRVVALRPEWADAHNDLASSLAASGQVKEAEQHLRRALQLDPNHELAKQNLALLLRAGGGGH